MNPTHEDYSLCEEYKRAKHKEKCSKKGAPYDFNAKLTYLPWQQVWLKGLVNLARSGETQNMYIVCWTSGDFEGLFENKFKGLVYAVAGGSLQEMWKCTHDTAAVTRVWCELSEAEQKKRAFASDFDPAFALGRVAEASTILDWERRCILRVAQAYPNVMVRYINQHGQNPAGRWDHKPQWYPELSNEEQLAGGLPVDEVVWQSLRVAEQELDGEIPTKEQDSKAIVWESSNGLCFERQERGWSREEAACAIQQRYLAQKSAQRYLAQDSEIMKAQAREEQQAVDAIQELRADHREAMRKDFLQRRRENSAVSTEYDERSDSEYTIGQNQWEEYRIAKKAFHKYDPEQTGTVKTSQLRGIIINAYPDMYPDNREDGRIVRCAEDDVCICERCEYEEEDLTEDINEHISELDPTGSGEITLLEWQGWCLGKFEDVPGRYSSFDDDGRDY
jgi:hypothetical protein